MTRKLKFLIATLALTSLGIAALVALAVIRARSTSSSIPACHESLVLVDLAKHDWASENHKVQNDTPAWDDLQPYFPDWIKNSKHWTNGKPICPDGGTYTIGKVSEQPKCSIGGGYSHSLLQ